MPTRDHMELVSGLTPLTFRGMTYCNSDCINTVCFQHRDNEKADRKKAEGKLCNDLVTKWDDFSVCCELYCPPR